MYVHVRSFPLVQPQDTQGRFFVNPIGRKVEVEMPRYPGPLRAEFEQLDFVPDHQGCTWLICRGASPGTRWQLRLRDHDAHSLGEMIHEARDDMDDLMRDL